MSHLVMAYLGRNVVVSGMIKTFVCVTVTPQFLLRQTLLRAN
jgi:hypothetical protein